MVKLTFNAHGFAFENGVTVLLDTYRLASEALDANHNRLKVDLANYEESMASGEPPVGEWDDEGYTLWTQDRVLELQIEDAQDALHVLRMSFVVALYHHWERWLRRELNYNGRGHAKLVAKAIAHGINLDSRIHRVVTLANLLKHSNDDLGPKLLISWPELLPATAAARAPKDWYAAVILTNETVQEAAEVVLASGPRRDKAYAAR